MSSQIINGVFDAERPTQKQIADYAYYLFEKRGRQPGHEMEDWLQAEAALTASDGELDQRAHTVGDGDGRSASRDRLSPVNPAGRGSPKSGSQLPSGRQKERNRKTG